MPLEEAQRLLKELDTQEHGERFQQIDAALAKVARGVSARGGYVKSQVRRTLLELSRLKSLRQRRQMVQDLWRKISFSFLRHLFGRSALNRILTILDRQEQQADVRTAEADALCKSLLIDSDIDEARAEINLVREALKALSKSGFSKLGEAANTINARMERFNDVIQLVGSITSANYNIQSRCDQYYHEFRNLLTEDYHRFALEDNYPQEAEAYVKLQGVLADMGNIRLAPRLATRNMCAVAGKFSSGKSSFLNFLIGAEKDLLPRGISKTTSIPTYIFHITGEEQSINVFNHNGGSAKIEPAHLQMMTHDLKKPEYGIQLKHLVERVSIYTPKLANWKNVAFIDTPGYSNPDEGEGVDSDEEIALRSVWKSRFLIWLVDCENGTLQERDVEFIQKFLYKRDLPNESKPIYLVVSKADSKMEDQLEGVRDQVAQVVKRHEIPCFGIGLHSAYEGKWYEPEDQSFEDFLSMVGEAELVNIETLKDEVKQVFDRYVEWHRTEQERLENTLGLMNRLALGVDTRREENEGEEEETARGGRGNAPSALEKSLDEHIRALSKQIEVHKQWSEKASGLRSRFLRSIEGFIKEINSMRDLR